MRAFSSLKLHCSLHFHRRVLGLLSPASTALSRHYVAMGTAAFRSSVSFPLALPSRCRSLFRRRVALSCNGLQRTAAPPLWLPARCLSSQAAAEAAEADAAPSLASFSPPGLSLPASEVSDAFEVIGPAVSALPSATAALRVLVTCEHASQRLPDGLTLPPADSHLLGSHWSVDLGAEECVRELLQLSADGEAAKAAGGAPLQLCALLSRCSRLVVDINRPVDSETLIRTTAEGRSIELNSQLSPHEFEDRVCRFHAPYHAALQRLRAAFAPHCALSVHSFTPLYEGQRRELEVGVLYRRREDADAAQALLSRFRQSGLKAELNQPWSGMRGFMHAMDSLTAAQQQQKAVSLQTGTAAFVASTAAEALRNTAADAAQAERTTTAGSSHNSNSSSAAARSPFITLMVEFRQDLLTNRRWRSAAVRMLRDFLCSLQQRGET